MGFRASSLPPSTPSWVLTVFLHPKWLSDFLTVPCIPQAGVLEGGGLCTGNSLSRSAVCLPQHSQTKAGLKSLVLS